MSFTFFTVVLAAISMCSSALHADVQSTAEGIRTEAMRPNISDEGHPLPLACSWTCGHFQADHSAGWRPENQMRLIKEGHHLLLWFAHPPINDDVPTDPNNFWLRYYKGPIETARKLKLPLTFIASQWESGLSSMPYIGLPAEQNPNVVALDGKVQRKVSPFGPVGPWREIGATHADNPWMKQLQQWYPDPPLVIFLSNNEHTKLRWTEVESSKRYLEKYGKNCDSDFKRKVVADGWIERYRNLQDGMRQGLANDTWKKNSIYVGYDAFGPPHFGRWDGWIQHSLYSKGRIDPNALMWDGGSPSYYTDDWKPRTDYTVWSPQVEFMNLVFMQREALKLNPRFWFEFSVWDGYHASPEREKKYPSKRGVYRRAGQIYNPDRYSGFVQFGMWLMRPRAVREYRGWQEPWNDLMEKDGGIRHEGGGQYFMAIVKAVDRVHTNPLLRHWWQKGQLVSNREQMHPCQASVPEEYRHVDRWFLLNTSLDAERPWSLETQIPVFSLALVQGEKPARQWLIYAHSPRGHQKDVKVTVPGYKQIAIMATVGGSFYLVDEAKSSVELIGE